MLSIIVNLLVLYVFLPLSVVCYDPSISIFSFEINTQPRLILDAYETRRYLRDHHKDHKDHKGSSSSSDVSTASSSSSIIPHAPLYRGMGTHFIYLWVGTPPQRVSVIVDTGSHYTAFPCKGCSNCGTHTDHYWDPHLSSTAKTQQCGSSNCRFSQSYTEGSSWQAYKVSDVVWIGGERADMLEKVPKFSVNFTFGCQTSETGLFRTQVENGIMGLSSDPNTLPFVLHSNKILPTRLFSLCLLSTGGVMSIGDSNSNLNLHPMQYAHLMSKSGYYTVYVENIYLKMPGEKVPVEYHDIGEPKTKINSGKGIIVDSGTTDSYLPAAIANSFRKLYQKLTGIYPSNSHMTLTQEQHHNLPTIVFRMTASSSSPSASDSSSEKTIDVEFPPWNYLEPQPDGKYVMRLYLTEGSGGVIGANMMIGHNILFDTDNQRVGFAKSECKKTGQPLYDEVTKPKKLS